MKEMFDPCVNRTLELIDGQVASILKNGQSKPKVRNKNMLPFPFPSSDSSCRWFLWSEGLGETSISIAKSASTAESGALVLASLNFRTLSYRSSLSNELTALVGRLWLEVLSAGVSKDHRQDWSRFALHGSTTEHMPVSVSSQESMILRISTRMSTRVSTTPKVR